MFQIHHNSIPNRRTVRPRTPKQITVSRTDAPIAAGKLQFLCSSQGKRRNIGIVGNTYQNVYQAWLPIFCEPCFSTNNQIITSVVVQGSAPINAPSRSLRFANSEMITTSPAVTAYFNQIGMARPSQEKAGFFNSKSQIVSESISIEAIPHSARLPSS